MAYEVTRGIKLREIEIETALARAKSKVISGKNMVVIAILRAGLGVVKGDFSL